MSGGRRERRGDKEGEDEGEEEMDTEVDEVRGEASSKRLSPILEAERDGSDLDREVTTIAGTSLEGESVESTSSKEEESSDR